MAEIRSVAVFGASGNSGDFVLPALLSTSLEVTVVTREGSKATFPPNVKLLTANYISLASLTSVLQGIDAVVSLVGSQWLEHQRLMIDAAVAVGAKYFIPSEFGHDWTDPHVFSLIPVFKRKYAIIEYLKTKEKDGLSWTMIITSLWFDWGLPHNMFDGDLKTRKATLWDGGNITFRATNVQDIARAVTGLLTNPGARTDPLANNTHMYISSVETTQNKLLAAAEEVTGMPFEVENVDSEIAFKNGESSIAGGDMVAVTTLLKLSAISKRELCTFGEKADKGNDLLLGAYPKESVKEVVRRVVEGRGPHGKLIIQN